MMNSNIPCPPAPRYGYNMLFDHKANTWYFLKIESSRSYPEIIPPIDLTK